MLRLNKHEENWLDLTLEALKYDGFCLIENVLTAEFCDEIKKAMYRVQDSIKNEVGESKLTRAKELGVLRIMMKHDPLFFRLIEIPELLEIVDHTVGDTAIMHLQNGFVLPSLSPEACPSVFQNSFHMDFKRVLNQFFTSVNVFFCIDDFHKDNGGTMIIPGSHQKNTKPSEAYMRRNAVTVEAPAGTVIAFDSTIWHAAGPNLSGKDRIGINHQFTLSWIKQQIDYVRAIGSDLVTKQKPRIQQILGYYTRVVSSYEEFYQPEEKRLYRADQG